MEHRMRAVFLALSLTAAGLAGCGQEVAKPASGTAQTEASTPPPAAQPGALTLVDTEGKAVDPASLQGKPAALYFGSTHDTGAARTVLANFASAVGAMGATSSGRVTMAFVSVDPERDTPEKLKAYLSEFGSDLQGWTGSPEAVAALAKTYNVTYAKAVADDGSYTVEHPVAVRMYDRDSFFLQGLGEDRTREEILSELRKLAGSRIASGQYLGPGARR